MNEQNNKSLIISLIGSIASLTTSMLVIMFASFENNLDLIENIMLLGMIGLIALIGILGIVIISFKILRKNSIPPYKITEADGKEIRFEEVIE